MRVLGVDPGLRNMGWGVIEAVGSESRMLQMGSVTVRVRIWQRGSSRSTRK